MFPKKNKLSRKDFTGGSFDGLKIHSPLYTLIFTNNPAQKLNLGVVISKKISKKAVTRNTIKRKIYSVLKNTINTTLPYKILLITKPTIQTVSNAEISKNLQSSFTQIKNKWSS